MSAQPTASRGTVPGEILARLVLHWVTCCALTAVDFSMAFALRGALLDVLGVPLWGIFGLSAGLCFSVGAHRRVRRAGQWTYASLTFLLALVVPGWDGEPYPFWVCVVAAHLSATVVFHLWERQDRAARGVRAS